MISLLGIYEEMDFPEEAEAKRELISMENWMEDVRGELMERWLVSPR
jgi:hypothetical protein